MTTQLDHVEDTLSAIQEHVWLVTLNIGWPKMSHQIADSEVTVKAGGQEKTVDEAFRSSPQWALIPEEWKEQLTKIEGKARRKLEAASVKFGTKGSCLLPIARAGAVFAELRECKAEFEAIGDRFTLAYTDILRGLEEKLGPQLYQLATHKLPVVEEVRERFKMRWAIIPLGGDNMGTLPQTFWDELTSAVDLVLANHPDPTGPAAEALRAQIEDRHRVAMQRLRPEEADELVQEARDQMRQIVAESVREMVEEPKRQIIKACENMLDAVRDDRTIRSGTIDMIRRSFEHLQGFEFMADPDLLASVQAVKGRLSQLTPQMLNTNRAAGLALVAALQPVLEQARQSTTPRVRGLRIRNQEPAVA